MLLEFQGVMNSSTSTLGEANVLKCELAAEVLLSSGSLRLCVTGSSMLPAIWPGDTLVIERVASHDVREGDIALFRRERRIFAHRVVGKNVDPGGGTILTRGDAMPQCDPPVPTSDLLGRVVLILREGKRMKPARALRLSERAVAAGFRYSPVAARVFVRVHGMLQKLHGPSSISTSRMPTSRVQIASL